MNLNNIEEYQHRSIHLREYVRLYIPKTWGCNLDSIMCIPYWNNDDYDMFKKGDYYNARKHPVIKLAIKSYFRKK